MRSVTEEYSATGLFSFGKSRSSGFYTNDHPRGTGAKEKEIKQNGAHKKIFADDGH